MDPFTLQLAAVVAPQLYKGFMGLVQGNEADKLKPRDTTPPAFKEALALGRQSAASTLPGTGAQLNQVQGGVNDTLSAVEKAGTSGQSVLGMLTAADATRNKYLTDLATRGDQYHQQQENKLTGLLGQQAQYQQKDADEFNKAKAALTEAGQRNLYSGIDGTSQVLAYALSKNKDKDKEKTSGSSATRASALSPIGPDTYTPRYRYGVPDPTLSGFSTAGSY